MSTYRDFLSYTSVIRKNIAEISFDYYDGTNIFDNDRFAIMSRIDHVERNQPRRSFLNIF